MSRALERYMAVEDRGCTRIVTADFPWHEVPVADWDMAKPKIIA